MAQPAAPFQSRSVVRASPYSTPFVFVGSLGAGLTQSVGFEIYQPVSDRNAFTAPNPGTFISATGPFLDVDVFSDQAGTLDVRFLASLVGASSRSIMPGGTPIVVAASTPGIVAGLRIIGQVVFVNYINTAGVAANIEFTAIVRSV